MIPSVFYAPLTYDAVWSLALALNNSIPHLDPGSTLENFTYEDSRMTGIFMEQMYKLDFAGMTVRSNYWSQSGVDFPLRC